MAYLIALASFVLLIFVRFTKLKDDKSGITCSGVIVIFIAFLLLIFQTCTVKYKDDANRKLKNKVDSLNIKVNKSLESLDALKYSMPDVFYANFSVELTDGNSEQFLSHKFSEIDFNCYSNPCFLNAQKDQYNPTNLLGDAKLRIGFYENTEEKPKFERTSFVLVGNSMLDTSMLYRNNDIDPYVAMKYDTVLKVLELSYENIPLRIESNNHPEYTLKSLCKNKDVNATAEIYLKDINGLMKGRPYVFRKLSLFTQNRNEMKFQYLGFEQEILSQFLVSKCWSTLNDNN